MIKLPFINLMRLLLFFTIIISIFCACAPKAQQEGTGDIDKTVNEEPVETETKVPAPVFVEIPNGAVGMGPKAFGKNPLVVKVGTTVTWTNKDTLTHTVTHVFEVFDSGYLKPGSTFSYMFQYPGEYYYSDVRYGYESMSGLIKVIE